MRERLEDPARSAAVRARRVLDTVAVERFYRLVRLASAVLDAPAFRDGRRRAPVVLEGLLGVGPGRPEILPVVVLNTSVVAELQHVCRSRRRG